ncbi:MAG: DUF4403 family protein [Saprospiraceae bacterium]|nr:DUF4403 family protein [Saprospiraceae bacterium]
MKLSIFFYSSIFLLFLTSSCSSPKKAESPKKEVYSTYKPLPSQVVLHYRLDKKIIRDTFNNAIAEIFKESFSIPDYDVKINFYKTNDANIEIEGKSVLVNIPVGILVEKNTMLVDFKAKGVVELTFITKFEMDSLWNFTSKTDLSYYKWLEKPILKMGGLQIPIEPLSDVIISKSKAMIVESIDDAIIENFTIKSTIQKSIQVFKEPIQLDPENGGYLTLTPSVIKLTSLKNSKLHSSGKIVFDLQSLFSTNKPVIHPGLLKTPALRWVENVNDTTVLRLVTQINMLDINTLVRKNFDGKEFSSQGKSFTMSNILINCDYENIRFVTDIKGDANGTLILTGKPKYDKKSNTFKTENIDIAFKTKNKIHKAAAWIAEGFIRKELTKMMTFPLEEKLDEIQNDINTQLKDINQEYNMDLKADLYSITSEHFEMKPGAIETTIKASLKIEAYIKDLRKLGAPIQKK